MNRRDVLICLAAAAGLSGCARRAPSWVHAASARYAAPTALPAPVLDGGMALTRAIALRRSVRDFGSTTPPLATIGQLLWAGQGLTSTDGKRAAPSAGALYPLELYVVTATQLMHYLPSGHRVEIRSAPDLRPELRTSAFGQEAVAAAPVVLVVAADAERTRRKYGNRATAFVDREAGHAAQNILLQAVAHGLGAVPIGSVDPARAAAVLGLPAGQDVRYLIPVGAPAVS
jgi:SagB-type dehydrogenase family enzyme